MNETTYERGKMVVCIDPGESGLTYGQAYEVEDEYDEYGTIFLVGMEDGFDARRFVPKT